MAKQHTRRFRIVVRTSDCYIAEGSWIDTDRETVGLHRRDDMISVINIAMQSLHLRLDTNIQPACDLISEMDGYSMTSR